MSEYGYTHPISVRLGDVDTNEHVNNTAYTDYFQEARVNYFEALWGEDWDAASVVLATLSLDFLAPIGFGEDVAVDVRVTAVGDSSWTVEYRVRAIDEAGTERVAARGSSVQVAWDREAATSRPLPESWRAALEDELVAAES